MSPKSAVIAPVLQRCIFNRGTRQYSDGVRRFISSAVVLAAALLAGAGPQQQKEPAIATVAKTGQTTSCQPGDDGHWRAGFPWPTPRFTMGTGATANCVTDNLTGLMWIKNPTIKHVVWEEALKYCEALDGGQGRGGFSDWRMPNVLELQSLIDYGNYGPALPTGHPFGSPTIPLMPDYYWTSTSYKATPLGVRSAFFLDMGSGGIGIIDKESNRYLLPVRGPLKAAKPKDKDIFMLAKTGQVIPLLKGDDGQYKAGTSWPTPRFATGKSDAMNCITDNLTGLVWLKNPTPETKTWADAIAYCEALDGEQGRGGFTDWRLPNVLELGSLIDYGNVNPAFPSNHPFGAVSGGHHWTSNTIIKFSDDLGFFLDVGSGCTSIQKKSNKTCHVFPVRGGTIAEPDRPLRGPVK